MQNYMEKRTTKKPQNKTKVQVRLTMAVPFQSYGQIDAIFFLCHFTLHFSGVFVIKTEKIPHYTKKFLRVLMNFLAGKNNCIITTLKQEFLIRLFMGSTEARLGRQQSSEICKTLAEVAKEDASIWGAFPKAQGSNFAREEAGACAKQGLFSCESAEGARRHTACLESHKTDLFLVIKNIDVH